MKQLARLVALALLSAGCGPKEHAGPATVEITLDRDDIQIRVDTKVRAGTYRIADADGDGVIHIVADGITLDLTGVTLIGSPDGTLPDSYEGIAVKAEGRTGVRVRGGTLRGFRGGVYFSRCRDCVVEAVEVSDNRAQRLRSTPAVCDDGADWLGPHFNDGNEWWKEYGAGIYLDECASVTVHGCTGRRTQNGICLRSTNDSRIIDNDMSWMSGWGIALWRSSRNEVSHNSCDWCVRGYSFGVYDRGQDSSGILMFEQCSDNVIAKNSATHGGDGIFMYAGHETTQRTGKGGCSRNLLWRNDFSHAVANAIECTFSDGNRFIENVLDDSNYGVWAGYSYNTTIEGNTCRNSRVAGVAIEHGHDNAIVGNTFERGADGVQLWWDEDAEFLKSPYGLAQNCRSERADVSGNTFRKCRRAFWLRDTSHAAIERNVFEECRELGTLEGACPEVSFAVNDVTARKPEAWIRNATGTPFEAGPNCWRADRPADGGDVAWSLPLTSLKFESTAPGPGPSLTGSRDTRLPEGTRRGMDTIVVGEWGPCEPWIPRLLAAGKGARLEYVVLGKGPWKPGRVSGPVRFLTDGGPAPGRLELIPNDDAQGVVPFAFDVEVGGTKLESEGVLIRATWSVEFWKWIPRDAEHGGYAAALDAAGWAAITAAEPFATVTRSELRRPWDIWDGPNPPVDHFATRSRARLYFPAGTFRIRTVSDDGVRVSVDGKRVIDNWDWHGPESDVAEVALTEGEHEIVVEHFEIDGYETLELSIEPVR